MNELLVMVGQWFRPYQYQCAMAIIATLLVVFGNDINQAVRVLLKKYHIVIRVVAFVFICAFGYGLLTIWLTGLLAQQLMKVPDLYILPIVLGVFFFLGLYAQKQRHI